MGEDNTTPVPDAQDPSPNNSPDSGAQEASSPVLAPARAEIVADTLRGRLQELAPSRIDLVVESLDMALQAKKTARGYCKKCETSVVVDVNDSIAAVNAFKALLEATEGRPAQAGELSQTPPIVRRVGLAQS